jgi:putative endonuclease
MSSGSPKGRAKRLGGKIMNKRAEINERGIELASSYLEREGVEVIEREWKCESGIADLIVKEDDELAFVQVKTHGAGAKGLPEDGISDSTRSKFEQLAVSYLMSHDLPSCRVRFDIISILLCESQKALLRHHRSAIASGA